jgi:polyribonucleotide nucleotidyltransferase
LNQIVKEFKYGNREVKIETGKVAKQATGSVMVSIGETVVLTTVVGAKSARPGQDFFPLTVNYQEKTYAAGKIPGGFFRREGRPNEKETLTCRLIDRPIRPLFPKGFMNEVQVVCTVLSAEKDQDPDIAALIGTSAALAISGIPFKGPIGAARVGYQDGSYILNPGYEELKNSSLNMTVAGTQSAVLMVESEAKELSEDEMLGAVLFAHQEMQIVIENVGQLAQEAGKPKWDWVPDEVDPVLLQKVSDSVGQELQDAYGIKDKLKRLEAVKAVRTRVIEEIIEKDQPGSLVEDISDIISKLEKTLVRRKILDKEPRIDGRDLRTVRPINVEVGVLPKTHGSAIFTRGETQAIAVATLGTLRDAAIIDALEGTYRDQFMLHYNFPPYSVGETGMMGGTKRRETGHGRLARRGVAAVLPDSEDFPYTIRVVSEITESNGSSSMASVCGTSLALMDAGVPLKAPVAGIAMGLVLEGSEYAVLTDILGDEDHLGDMDFKVAGTAQGITALQMDIKIEGINEEIMESALEQAQEARVHILDEMNKVLKESRSDLSENAPAMTTVKVHPDKIRDIIGKGGATIRGIVEATGAEVDIDDDGLVRIYAETAASKDAAIDMVNSIIAEAEVGRVYQGKVERIVDFGAFVNILPGKDGLLHISQIADERVEKVSDYLSEGEEIDVVVLDVDQRGRIKLSIKEIPDSGEAESENVE